MNHMERQLTERCGQAQEEKRDGYQFSSSRHAWMGMGTTNCELQRQLEKDYER